VDGGQSDFPGWEAADEHGTIALDVMIGGGKIRLATVTYDDETGLYETFIGHRFQANQLGRIDSSQERAVKKAEEFLTSKLQRLLLPAHVPQRGIIWSIGLLDDHVGHAIPCTSTRTFLITL
jgi:hypothetical protein